MSVFAAWGVLCGVGFGLGLWSMLAVLPRLSWPRLADRVAPYVVDISDEARMLTARTTVHPLPLVGALVQPLIGGLRRGVSRTLGGGDTIALRLRQAGSSLTVDGFRSQQLLWGAFGFAAGLAIAVLAGTVVAGSTRPMPAVAQAALPLMLAACGFVAKDWLLKRAARARLRRIAAEFPTVVEFLTLSLAAGEGILDAIRRIARVSSGELARELSGLVADVAIGIPIATALTRVADGIRLPMLTRCVEAITASLERGTPLAEVLRAQAADARAESKRELLESAGKKEVAMLVPLVFLILPTTVLFAIYPGVFVLQSGF
ncbi:type II secretion system F family protein [Rathayibacter soli]|uniref:type II secretion system F family protein n=1 Tax=Rathayibacter soli TaxID=3144168 RepID=UPI0027E5178B|nr:type II secretion system F family protein [Glaciibacter superstes]